MAEIKDDLPEFNMDDLENILQEFSSDDTADTVPEDLSDDMNAFLMEISSAETPEMPEPAAQASEVSAEAAAPEAASEESAVTAEPGAEDSAAENSVSADASDEPAADAPVTDDTVRMDVLPGSPEPPAPTDEPTMPFQPLTEAPAAEADKTETSGEAPKTIPFNSRVRLQELKKKLVSGPEKRYYDLTEQGVLKLQLGMAACFVILLLSGALSSMYMLEMISGSRLKFVIFSQILGMLVSGLLGCHLMLDGLDDLFHLKFSLNTILAVTFLACCGDAVFCLQELRIPCCAAFTLEMLMAMLAQYHRRSTEMAQMDTMRKAVKLVSIVKQPDYYDGKDGVLRGEGDVEDFMDTYTAPSGPERVQNVFALVSLILCIGISVLSGLLHSVSMAVQIFSTSLLVAVPASFFVTVTRPNAILEKRLHMVGSVICGWRSVKKLCGKAVFPLKDEDLFPKGSTKLNGVKFYSERNPDEIVSFTSSVILAAGGGLVSVFRKLMASRNVQEYPVENFQDYGSGGIGAEVRGEPVLVGSLNFLQDMGVEIPQGTTVSQAVYCAIDGELVAVVAISYAKMRSAAAGLVSLCASPRIKPVLLAGDFMLTEEFIRSKFSVSSKKVAMPDQATRSALAGVAPDPEADVLALATRDDLVSYVYPVTGASALRTSCRMGLVIHILGGILGILTMLALAYLGSTELLTPINVLLYQLVWLVPGLLASEWTRTV